MIRLFQLRDLPLVHRLGDGGFVFDAESAAISYPHPVRSALINRLTGRNYLTYIWKHDEKPSSAFIQVRCEEGCSAARLLFLGTSDTHEVDSSEHELDDDVWLPMLDELVVVSGERGVHSLIAEVNEVGPELPMLRRAGFVVYTRQDIWIKETNQDDADTGTLKPFDSVDDWDVFVLYSNIVPRLIQSVEPNPLISSGENWVLREGHELAAFIHTNTGRVATWMRLLIHPNATTKPKLIVRAALATSKATQDHPVYCCVRKYQSWLQRPLEDEGFKYWGSQAVMVKHMTKAIKQQPQLNELGLEAQAVTSSSTLVQGFSQTNGKQSRTHNSE